MTFSKVGSAGKAVGRTVPRGAVQPNNLGQTRTESQPSVAYLSPWSPRRPTRPAGLRTNYTVKGHNTSQAAEIVLALGDSLSLVICQMGTRLALWVGLLTILVASCGGKQLVMVHRALKGLEQLPVSGMRVPAPARLTLVTAIAGE